MRCGVRRWSRRVAGVPRVRRGSLVGLAVAVLGTVAALAAVGGCTSPPSVAPLLRVAEAAMVAEAERLAADVARDRAHVEQTRRSLSDAFDLDLEARGELSVAWVRDGVAVYVAAREALVRHEAALEAERRVRAENLDAAAYATRRAIELIERQDRLIVDATRMDVWRLLRAGGTGRQGGGR
jgi:hypothetical protein